MHRDRKRSNSILLTDVELVDCYSFSVTDTRTLKNDFNVHFHSLKIYFS